MSTGFSYTMDDWTTDLHQAREHSQDNEKQMETNRMNH